MNGMTFSEYVKQNLADKDLQYSSPTRPSSTSDSNHGICQELISDYRLKSYQIEQQERMIHNLTEKVVALELHRVTQLGQGKIIGLVVSAIALSFISLATAIFFDLAPLEASTIEVDQARPVAAAPN
ncbi:MAG: hypothetical protein HC812_09655 [Leptolyngbya sp. RL_3_1]|nr:hypothetical protein [Leptolyngbya sp. RL_3_1]